MAEHVFAGIDAMARRVHTRLADQIGLSIVRGDVRPGEPLPSEQRLCGMLDVSRTAVREALRVLVGKGLIQSRPKSGTKVRPAEHWNHLDPDVLRWQFQLTDTDDYLRKLFEMRFAIDPPAAALAAEAATDAELEGIREAFEGMAEAVSNEDFVDADIAFHKGIYFATHNELFWPIAQMFEIALRESFRIAAHGDHRGRAIAEHRALMEAISARKPERARIAALKLLGNSALDLVVIRGRDPFRKDRKRKKPPRRVANAPAAAPARGSRSPRSRKR